MRTGCEQMDGKGVAREKRSRERGTNHLSVTDAAPYPLFNAPSSKIWSSQAQAKSFQLYRTGTEPPAGVLHPSRIHETMMQTICIFWAWPVNLIRKLTTQTRIKTNNFNQSYSLLAASEFPFIKAFHVYWKTKKMHKLFANYEIKQILLLPTKLDSTSFLKLWLQSDYPLLALWISCKTFLNTGELYCTLHL